MVVDRSGMTYAEAGVDIDAGNAFVRRIKPMAARTARSGATHGLGGFGALFDPKAAGYVDPVLVAATDGVGTKLRVAMDVDRVHGVGIDLVAMCVNDIVCQGAEPLFFLDYFATGKLEVDTALQVVAGISEGCVRAGCALIGGETAEMPDIYPAGEFDIAGFAVGAVERDAVLPSGVEVGDTLLGLSSIGVHANGFSLIRQLVRRIGLAWTDIAPFAAETAIADIVLAPTRIYVRQVLAALRVGGVSAVAHITGGGLSENLPRVLPGDAGVEIDLDSWDLPPVFRWIREAGNIADGEMLRIFNCGIGMVLICKTDRARAVAMRLEGQGETVKPIGRVTDTAGVRYYGCLA